MLQSVTVDFISSLNLSSEAFFLNLELLSSNRNTAVTTLVWEHELGKGKRYQWINNEFMINTDLLTQVRIEYQFEVHVMRTIRSAAIGNQVMVIKLVSNYFKGFNADALQIVLISCTSN